MEPPYEAVLQARKQRDDGACQLDRVDCDDHPYRAEFLAQRNMSERQWLQIDYDSFRL